MLFLLSLFLARILADEPPTTTGTPKLYADDGSLCEKGYHLEPHENDPNTGDLCRNNDPEIAAQGGYKNGWTCPLECEHPSHDHPPFCVFPNYPTTPCRTSASEFMMKHVVPAEDRTVVIWNKRYSQTKLMGRGQGNTVAFTDVYKLDKKMIMMFEKSPVHADHWVISTIDENGKNRIRCTDNGRIQPQYGGALDNRDEWTFKEHPTEKGWYEIENLGHQGSRIGVYRHDWGGCMPRKYNCQDPGTCDWQDNSYGQYAGDCDSDKQCWGDMKCDGYCKDIYSGSEWSWSDDCCILPGGDYASMDTWFRFEDIFATEALWQPASIIQNDTPDKISHKYSLQWGVTNSIMKSVAKSLSISKGMEASIGVEAKGIGASVSMSYSMTTDFSSSVETTTETSQMQVWETSFDVGPGECKKLLNIITATNDKIVDVDSKFLSKATRVMMCSDDDRPDCVITSSNTCEGMGKHMSPPAFEGFKKEEHMNQRTKLTAQAASTAADKTTKLHTLDNEYHMKEENSDTVMDKEETWSKKERKEFQLLAQDGGSISFPVKVLAAFGFAVSVYGAFKHFSK